MVQDTVHALAQGPEVSLSSRTLTLDAGPACPRTICDQVMETWDPARATALSSAGKALSLPCWMSVLPNDSESERARHTGESCAVYGLRRVLAIRPRVFLAPFDPLSLDSGVDVAKPRGIAS
jgi:hypothetical protein